MQKLLLLHGALGGAENFTELKNHLEQDFEIYSLNFEGHGGNSIPQNPLSISNFADAVIAFLNQNGIDKIAVFGYSMGGYVGLYLARHFPERIEKLLTLATKLNWTVEGADKESKMLNPETIKEKLPKYAVALQNLHGQNWEQLLIKTAEMMQNLGASPALNAEDFSQITIPVLVAVGDKDAMVTIEESVNAYRLLPDAQFLVLPKTPHPIEKVDAAELARQIKKYFL
jgi:pimeloyl-ACP methyl ester carboxylesterase